MAPHSQVLLESVACNTSKAVSGQPAVWWSPLEAVQAYLVIGLAVCIVVQGAAALVPVATSVGLGLFLGDVYEHSHSLYFGCGAFKHVHLELLHGKVVV